MRVLLAHDASAGAGIATDLVAALHWPPGSSIRVVAALEPSTGAATMPLSPIDLPPAPVIEHEIVGYLESEVGRVVDRLTAAGLNADGHVVAGRPGSVLVEEAATARSDLIVVGSRGHGALASLVLGSVSAEVVDHAPCPVLVARRPTAERILLATDGSPSAADAETITAGWPIFGGAALRVVSVADVPRPWHAGVAPTMHHLAIEAYSKDLAAAKTRHEELARGAAERLTEAGRAADSRLRTGDSAAEIVAEASDWGADLIVMGSRGLTGLSRILLGSVARNVLHGSRTSVLVVRTAQAGTAKTGTASG